MLLALVMVFASTLWQMSQSKAHKMSNPRSIISWELLPLYVEQCCATFYPLPCLGPGEGPTPFPSSAEICQYATVGMGRGCSQVPLISSCPPCALQNSLALLQVKVRAEKRWFVTWSHGRNGKGRLWDVLPSKKGTEDPDAQYSSLLGLPPRGDTAQGQVFWGKWMSPASPWGGFTLEGTSWLILEMHLELQSHHVSCEPSVTGLCRYNCAP